MNGYSLYGKKCNAAVCVFPEGGIAPTDNCGKGK